MAGGQNKQSPCAGPRGRTAATATSVSTTKEKAVRLHTVWSELSLDGLGYISIQRQSSNGAHAPVWGAFAAARWCKLLNMSDRFRGLFRGRCHRAAVTGQRILPEITRGIFRRRRHLSAELILFPPTV